MNAKFVLVLALAAPAAFAGASSSNAGGGSHSASAVHVQSTPYRPLTPARQREHSGHAVPQRDTSLCTQAERERGRCTRDFNSR
jgi:hypothetical protein